MTKEVPKKIEVKTTLPEVMAKYGGMFTIEIKSGFAHLRFINDELFVMWLNDEGVVEEEGHEVPFRDIEIVANFMREMKELRLLEYEKKCLDYGYKI